MCSCTTDLPLGAYLVCGGVHKAAAGVQAPLQGTLRKALTLRMKCSQAAIASAARFAAQRLFVAPMILSRPSGVSRLLRPGDLPLVFFAAACGVSAASSTDVFFFPFPLAF